MTRSRPTPVKTRRGMVVAAILALVLVLLVGAVLVARHRLLPAEETWQVNVDGADRVLDSDEERILLGTDTGNLLVLDRETGATMARLALGPELESAALFESGVLAHWRDEGATETTLGLASGPDEWLWQKQLPAGVATVIGVDRAADRIVLARTEDDPVLQGLDANTGEVVWSRPGQNHSGWHGDPKARHAFFGQSALGVQEADGHWSLVSTEDGSVTADLGPLAPLTWHGFALGNGVADGCRPMVFHQGKWRLLNWEDEKPAPQCQWLQPATGIGWLDYYEAGGPHLRPVNLKNLAVGPGVKPGLSKVSTEHPPTVLSVQDWGAETRLLNTAGQIVWSHRGPAFAYPGAHTTATITDTDTLTELVALSRSVRRLQLLSDRGAVIAETTHARADDPGVHHLPGASGVVFVLDDDVILLGH